MIPTFNRARDLARALSSIVAQTWRDWEALVIDSHSTDDTDEVIRSFADARIHAHKIHNDGVIAASRNVGITRANGKYVAFLDSDDWWSPRKLELSVEHLEKGADVVYHDLFLATRAGQTRFWRRARTRELDPPVFLDLLSKGNALNNSSVVVRKELLAAIGGISEERSLIAVEDYDLWLRLARATDSFKRIPECLGYYWTGGGNVSNPARTLESVGVIRRRYADDFRRLGDTEVPWMSYAQGRAHFRLGKPDLARNSFRAIRWRSAPVSLTAKSVLMLGLLALRRLPVLR